MSAQNHYTRCQNDASRDMLVTSGNVMFFYHLCEKCTTDTLAGFAGKQVFIHVYPIADGKSTRQCDRHHPL